MDIVKANQERQLKRTDIEKVLQVDSKLSAATVQGYAGQSIQFFNWARENGVFGFYAVNGPVITNYKRALIDAGFKDKTINYKLKAVRAFYRQAVRAGKIDTNPTDGMTYEKEEAFTADYKALTKKQVEILFRELSKNTTERGLQRYAVINLITPSMIARRLKSVIVPLSVKTNILPPVLCLCCQYNYLTSKSQI